MQVRILPPLPSTAFDGLHEHQYAAYVHLLGLYLGDGHIARTRTTYRLMVSLHRDTPSVIDGCAVAMAIVVPQRKVGYIHRGQVVIVNAYFGGWPALFPQHGPGRKHLRRIELAPWQRGLVRGYPRQFVRGCLESDGSRHRRIVNGKDYPAYCFSNYSDDIMSLFGWACDLAGIRWRRATRVNISIARRPDVAAVDALMGRC